MNSLTWLIYLTAMIGKVSALFIVGGVFIGVLIAFRALCVAIQHDHGALEEISVVPKTRYVVIAILCIFIGNILPDRDTMVLMAASEVGQRVLSNDKVTATLDPALDLLNTWIAKQKEDLLKPKKSD